jgi:hypothetical protein
MFLTRRVVLFAAAIFAGLLIVGGSPFYAGLWMIRDESMVLAPPLLLALLVILGGSLVTCYYVFCIGLRELGLKYAVGHVLLCMAFSLMMLIGVIVVPLLVRYDIERRRQFEGELPDDSGVEPQRVPPPSPRSCRQHRLRWTLLLVTTLGLFYVLLYGVVIWHRNRPFGGHVTLRDMFSIELPPGSRLRIDQGYDSICGAFILPGEREIQFNVERRRWSYRADYIKGPFEWRKHEERNGLRMEFGPTSRRGANFLAAGFPQLGVGLSCMVEDERDLDKILKLMRTVQWPAP